LNSLTIESVGPDADEAMRLIRQLDADLGRRYPGIPIGGLCAADLADEQFTFLVARLDGAAVGCGALRTLEPGVGELKRMYVVPEFRGYGIARRILAALESRALELGQGVIRLETGRGQPEAIALYQSSGYSEIAGFGEYHTNEHAVCLEKRLD
jgi:GNAT superfamily N-acetyltransferase